MGKRSRSFLQELSEIEPKAVMTMVYWTQAVTAWLPSLFPAWKMTKVVKMKMATVYLHPFSESNMCEIFA